MDSTALIPVQYGLDTFYFVICGALVMWMAAGFAMLEAGLVRAKNTAEILTKNIVLYALASIMYLLVGYYIMYPVRKAAFSRAWASSSVTSMRSTWSPPAARTRLTTRPARTSSSRSSSPRPACRWSPVQWPSA